MITTSTARTRAVVRGLLWFLAGLFALVAAFLVGWFPPELAAWFSWRHKA
jgi:hypothetical protein